MKDTNNNNKGLCQSPFIGRYVNGNFKKDGWCPISYTFVMLDDGKDDTNAECLEIVDLVPCNIEWVKRPCTVYELHLKGLEETPLFVYVKNGELFKFLSDIRISMAN